MLLGSPISKMAANITENTHVVTVKYILVVFRNSIYNVSIQCISTRQFTIDVSYLDEHVHRQRDVQGRFALLHLQTVQALLQPHFTNSLHALDASGMVDQTGSHEFPTFTHA